MRYEVGIRKNVDNLIFNPKSLHLESVRALVIYQR